MDIIVAKDVRKKFKLKHGQQVKNNGIVSNEIDALGGFDLNIKKGEFLVLVGPSGSGKSVFLDIVGIYIHFPTFLKYFLFDSLHLKTNYHLTVSHV